MHQDEYKRRELGTFKPKHESPDKHAITFSKNHPVISPYVGTKLTCIIMEINIDTSQNALCTCMHTYIRALENSILFCL